MVPLESILLYTSPSQNDGFRMQSMVEKSISHENIIIVRQMENLSRVLRQPLNGITAAIIRVGSDEELVDLMGIRDLLLRIPMILVLPNQEKTTIHKGHVLRPRYLTYGDTDWGVVEDVFRKMVGRAASACQ